MSSKNLISRSVEIGLRIMGIWPDAEYLFIRRLFWAATIVLAQTFQFRHVVLHIGIDDLEDIMDSLSTTMTYSLLFFKLIILWTKHRVFRDILTSIATDWEECKTESNMRSMASTSNFSRRSSNLIIGLDSVSVIFYVSGVLLSPDDEVDPEELEMAERLGLQTRKLFLKMELPFESNTSPSYELVLVIQFFHMLSVATMVGVVNAFIIALTLHVGGQIDILCQELTEISSKRMQHTAPTQVVNILIKKHQRIIAMSDGIESMFTYIALMQFLWNTMVICALGYLITISIGVPGGATMLVKCVCFYIVMMLEALLFCSAGEYLGEKGRMIGDAAYDALWYNMTASEKRVLIFLIMRSQKRLTITIGKFMDLSLERFTTIVKTSGSYVSVLHAMS